MKIIEIPDEYEEWLLSGQMIYKVTSDESGVFFTWMILRDSL